MLRRFGEIMSVAPEFELGLLNAWILWVPLLVTLLLLLSMTEKVHPLARRMFIASPRLCC